MQKFYLEIKAADFPKLANILKKKGTLIGEPLPSMAGGYILQEFNVNDLRSLQILEKKKHLKFFIPEHKEGERNYCINCYLRKSSNWNHKTETKKPQKKKGARNA